MAYREMARACAATLALLGGTLATAAGPGAQLGQPAPELVVTQLDGHQFNLAALRGKVVVVNYWATWCSPCRAEMPVLNSFYQRYQSRGLVLLGLSVDEEHDRPAVAALMQKLSYPAAMAGSARANGFGAPLAVPMTWIIDTSGVVRARLISGNAVSEKTLSQAILPLLPPRPGGSD